VAYLQTALSELRSFTFRTLDGRSLPGKMLLDPLWEGFVRWHSVDTLEHNRAQTRAAIEAALSQLPQAQDKLRAFAELDAA
jgi:hypothetical protein